MKQIKRGLNGSVTDVVTEREIRHSAVSQKAAGEGFVLLKNEQHVLPVKGGSKIALYGAGASHTIKGGTGSGDVNERKCVSIYEGLLNAGYEITSREWIEAYERTYKKARETWKEAVLKKVEKMNNFFDAYSSIPFQMPCGDAIEESVAASDGADIAFFVLSRVAGENADRHDTEGDYFITKEEKALLSQVSRCYQHVVIIINTGGLMDLGFVEEYTNIHGIVQFMQAGQEGGNAFAELVKGNKSFSGKMTDTWALSYEDYPNADTFSHKSGDVFTEEYTEGIYVGYRYFDTFDVPVRYSFGFGLSYTDFNICLKSGGVKLTDGNKPKIQVEVEVTNVGQTYAGKEVVQIYVSCPQGKLAKEYRRLASFAKTEELKPQEAQSLEISFPFEQLASFDEERAAWILESGKYGIWIGNSLKDVSLQAVLELEQEVVLVACEHICPLEKELKELTPDFVKMQQKQQAWHKEAEIRKLPIIKVQADIFSKETIEYTKEVAPFSGEAGKIVEALSTEQLIAMSTGEVVTGGANALGASGTTVPGAAAETPKVVLEEPWNVASIVLADGPAGLRLKQKYEVIDGAIQAGTVMEALEGGYFAEEKPVTGQLYYQYCTAIPVGTLLAQTWNTELMTEVGEMIGKEMEEFFVTLWLAPGMNIHRNPLCGRNFEYYSEDPLLSGIMAASITRGVQKQPGCGTTIKHFACNNQEDNRPGSDSVLSERALREIYLKGFEIAVKSAQPMSIMTSYNMINGVHTANSYDLCTKVARDEWGFAGAIMTDWTTTTNSNAGVCTASGCMRAQNDMIMPGFVEDHENIRKELAEGNLKEEELKRCVYNTIRLILQSNRYEGAVSYSEQFGELDTYITVS